MSGLDEKRGVHLLASVRRVHALARLRAFHAGPRSLDAIVRRAMDLGSRGAYKVKSSQILSEILALARVVEALQPRNVLELGTARGGTLLLWSQLARERVVSCDLTARASLVSLTPHFPPRGSACRVETLVGDSHTPEMYRKVRDAFAGCPVDFLFIDGDHSEAGVAADFHDYAPLVRPGGIVAFHDIVDRQPEASSRVAAVWKHVRKLGESREWISDASQCGFGIGMLQVPATPGWVESIRSVRRSDPPEEAP